MVTEQDIMNNIRLELSERGYYTERTNVGKGYLVPTDVWNRIKHLIPESEQKKIRYFSTGAMVGRSDLSAIKDGKISFIEVKTDKGKPTKEQLNFIKVMKERYGCNAGIARSPEEAINLVSTGT